MKTAAIIAEYNPFHSGHKYHIEKTRELTGADYVLAVMSGHFVQRGAPALLDKYTRTRMALLGGADAVIELPTLYATSSAEYFAQGAVALIHKLGVVDVLSFGSEEGSIAPFLETASGMLAHEAEIPGALQSLMKKGLSYPAAKEQAALGYLSCEKDKQRLLSSPNNILGLEYCKALLAFDSKITPFTIKRKGQDFQDGLLPCGDSFASACAIRNAVASCPEQISSFIPKECREVFFAALADGRFLAEDDLSLLLHHQLLTHRRDGFSMYLDCTPDLSDKICKNIPDYTGFSDFCSLLKSKDLTYARLSRTLLHILLEIKQPSFYRQPYSRRDYLIPYARLLGFRKSAGPLLSAIKKKSFVPLITKMADAKNTFKGNSLAFLNGELFCASLYEAACRAKNKETTLNELKQSPVILE